MAWAYADYETQATDALRLSTLRAHIAEVEAAIDANVAKGSTSRQSDPLNTKIERLTERRRELERRTQTSVVFARPNRRY